MTVKVALLKSGEQIITDVKEMVSDEKVIGYFFENPYVVHLRNPELVISKDAPIQLEISLFNWLPLCKERQVPVPSDWVVTIFEPTFKLKDMYSNVTKKIKQSIKDNNDDKTDNASEQADSDKQD